MAIYQLDELTPEIHSTVYVAEDATVIGSVVLGEHSSVWPQAVLRGDNETINIGRASNIQEGAVLHVDPGYPLVLGEEVTVGHQAMLHGCNIGDGSLIGIQSVILNGAVIGKNCIVAAGAVVTQGKIFPDNSLIIGAPAKVARELDQDTIHHLKQNAAEYVERAQHFKKRLKRLS